jgi:hypothetical protein
MAQHYVTVTALQPGVSAVDEQRSLAGNTRMQ